MRIFDIADIRSHPEFKAQAAAWFHSKWEVPEEEYLTSMDECISGGANVPQWHVALEDGVKVYLDESLKRFETVFPAAGSANSAIELTIPELEKYSKFDGWVDVCKPKEG